MKFKTYFSNETQTWNGDLAYKSTLSKNLDLFCNTPRLSKNSNIDDVIQNINEAWNEDKKMLIANLLNIIDVRGGKGEKFYANLTIQMLDELAPQFLRNNLLKLAELTRFDRLFQNYIYLSKQTQKLIIELIKSQSENGLMYKWLPSINASNQITKNNAKAIANGLGTSLANYRKWVSENRKKYSNLIETKITNKDYDSIVVSEIPKLAFKKYSRCFWRNIDEKLEDYYDALKKGEKKVNVDILTPYDILNFYLDKRDAKAANELWKQQKDVIKGEFFPVIDVSGSMNGIPKTVATSLGIYCSERNKGNFKDKVMIFSNDAAVLNLNRQETLIEKYNYICRRCDIATTNFDAIYKRIIELKGEGKEIPEKVLIITDCQFNSEDGTFYADKSALQRWKTAFKSAGLKAPLVIFWNVAQQKVAYPFEKIDSGVIGVSGFSIWILNVLDKLKHNNLNSISFDLMKKTLKKYFLSFNFDII